MVPLWRGRTNEKRTGIERRTERFLIRSGVEYTFQRMVGPFIVDFWLDEYGVAVEVDGKYWHSLPSRRRRDVLFEEYCRVHDIAFVRLKEVEVNKGDFSKLSLLLRVVRGFG